MHRFRFTILYLFRSPSSIIVVLYHSNATTILDFNAFHREMQVLSVFCLYFLLQNQRSGLFCKSHHRMALPMSLRIYLLSKFTHAVASYAFARASFRVAPVAVTPKTRPPLVTTLPSASNFEPA